MFPGSTRSRTIAPSSGSYSYLLRLPTGTSTTTFTTSGASSPMGKLSKSTLIMFFLGSYSSCGVCSDYAYSTRLVLLPAFLTNGGVGAGGQRYDLTVVLLLNDLGLNDGDTLAPLAHLSGRGERTRLARLHVVDGDLDREGLLAFLDHRVQGFGHRDVDQG